MTLIPFANVIDLNWKTGGTIVLFNKHIWEVRELPVNLGT